MKIKINDNLYVNFNGFSVSSILDSVASVFSFTVKYDHENQEHKEIFRPLSYNFVQFYNDDNVLFFTGTIVSHKFNSKSSPELLTVSGYSLPGILEDCGIPYSAFPLESLNVNLKQITQKILKNFPQIGLVIDSSVVKECALNYEKSVAEVTESVKDYLSKLAAQRNVLLSHDRRGNLMYFRPNSKAKSIFYYTWENCTDMSFDIDGQGLHSHLTILRQASKDNSNLTPEDTLKNPLVRKFRPIVNTLSSGDITDTKSAVNNFLADELKNIKLKIEVEGRWDPIYTGQIVDVYNPEIFIHKRVRFMVQNTVITETEKGRKMSLTLMLPETFSGETPKNIFQ